MNNTRIKTIALTIAAVLLLTAVFATSVFAAFFTSSVPIGSDVIIHEIDWGVSTSFENLVTDFKFTYPGEKKEIPITISNTSSEYYHYFFGIALMDQRAEGEDGLEKVILVYFDGEYLGTLAQLAQKGEHKIDNDFYLLKGSASSPSSEEHTLTFELHNAADGSYFEDKSCKVNILSYAQNYDVNKVIFVSSAKDLRYALYDISAESDIFKTIILTADIDLSELASDLDSEDAEYLTKLQKLQLQALNASNPCAIDLRGHHITFNGFYINLLHQGILTVKSSRNFISSKVFVNEGESADAGGFLLNNPFGVVDFADSVKDYAFYNFDIVSDGENGLQYNGALAAKLMKERFLSKLSNLRLYGAQSFEPLGALYCYCQNMKGDIAFEIPLDAPYSFENSTGLLTPPSLYNSVNTSLTLDGEKIIFKLVGEDEGAFEALKADYLQHIPGGSGDGSVPNITYDLFLPLRIEALNASISWKSSNTSLISNSGKIEEKAEGEVFLTATIKINEDLYYEVFRFYVVRQDNEMKFLYLLARLNPIKLLDVYPQTGSSFVLPVVDESDENHYTKFTGGKELGLTALQYQVDPSFYYLQMGDADALEATKPTEIYLKEPTFQVYAQVSVTGYFGTESYTGSIGIKIELGENAELLDNVFDYVSSCLSGVDVLQNIIDTRVLYGMQVEKGDFLLPSSYNGFDIEYSYAYSQGIVSSVTSNGSGKYIIGINASNFNSTDTAAALTVRVYKPSLEGVDESRNLYFNAPAVLKQDSEGFSNEEIYNAIKLQVWQQLPQNEQLDIGIIDGEVDVSSIANWDYILMRDVKLVSALVFQNGSPEQLFTALLGWATSITNAGQEVQSVMSFFEGSDYAQNVSDGNVFISAEEKEAIAAFLGRYDGFDTQWSAATTKAYNLRTEDIDLLLNSPTNGITQFLAKFVNLSLPFNTTSTPTDTFSEYIDWARGTSYHTTFLGFTKKYTLMSDYGASLGKSTATTTERINPGVTTQEIADIVAAYAGSNIGFKEFANAWESARNALSLPSNSDFYVLLTPATNASESQMTTNLNSGSSNYRKGYIYTGTTTSTYTNGHLYILCRYIADGTFSSGSTTYGYFDAGLASTAKYTYDDALQTAIVSAMKSIIANRYNTLLNWAKGSGISTAGTAAGISYLSSTSSNYSDGKATVSFEEKDVLFEFWNKALPAAHSGFATLWNANVPQVDVFTDDGIALLNQFYQNAQGETENLSLLNITQKILRGMNGVIASADKTQIGSIYQFTGTGSAAYTKNAYYRLSFNAPNYYFEETSVTELSSSQEMYNALTSAQQSQLGSVYLYMGEDGDFTQNLAYILSYDSKNSEYFFKAHRIEEISDEEYYQTLYYPYVTIIDAYAKGLSYFTNLKELYVFGAPSDLTPIFTSANNARNFFNRITLYNTKLEKLVMQYASLGDISLIGVFKNLTYLDLSGNGNLTQGGALTNLNLKKLSYLDLHKTGMNYQNNLATFSQIYYGYKNAKGEYPEIYYTLSGERTLFETELTQEEITILNYLFYLKEIGSSNSIYTLLTSKVYVSSSPTDNPYGIEWFEIKNNAETELSKVAIGSDFVYRYTNLFSGTGTSSSTVLRAKITVGSYTFYRDFEVILLG